MFTGIIEKQSKVKSVFHQEGQSTLVVKTDFNSVQLGESIAVNGVCLTVSEVGEKGDLVFYLNPETIEKTALGQLEINDLVNLERAMKLGDRFSGHWVQGHTDGTGVLNKIREIQETHQMWFLINQDLGRYIVQKGSVAIDGVSLTISDLEEVSKTELIFSVHIIPHTWKWTRLSQISVGQKVNIEVDILAKYVEKLCQSSLKK